MHHFRISDVVSALCFVHLDAKSLTLRLQLLQLSIQELEVRFAEVDFRQTILARRP